MFNPQSLPHPFVLLVHGDFSEAVPRLAEIFPDRKPLICSDFPDNDGFPHYKDYSDDLPAYEWVEKFGIFRNLAATILMDPVQVPRLLVPALGNFEDTHFWCFNDHQGVGVRQVCFFNP